MSMAAPYVYGKRVSAQLIGIVDTIVGYAEGGVPLRGVIQPASLAVPLIISFVDAFQIRLGGAAVTETWSSFTSGLAAAPVELNSDGRSECIQVDFTPLGARRFFGLPMREISNRVIALEDIDPAFARLRQKLGDTPAWSARLAMVEAFVLDRVMRQPTGRADVARAWDILVTRKGNVRIADIATDLEISRKHLAALFHDHIGLGAKSVARVIRFNAALAEAAAASAPDWADIAAGCGYADQAHLSREFHALAGYSPCAWPAAR